MAVGQLNVRVAAETMRANKNLKTFRGGVKSARTEVNHATKSFKSFGKSIDSNIGSNLIKMAGGLTAVAVATKSFRAFTSTANDLDRLSKTAAKLGIATDQLVGLRHAATQTGVAVGTLDTALQRQVKRVAEAEHGTGEAVKALRELGLSARELNRLAPDQQFGRIADAMQRVSLQGDKNRLAMKLWDSEGVSLVNTIKGGSVALDAFQKEARDLGIAVKAGLPQVEAFNDAWDKLGKVGQGALREMTIDIAPAATRAINQLVTLYTDAKGGKYPLLYSGDQDYIQQQRKSQIQRDQEREHAEWQKQQRKGLVSGNAIRFGEAFDQGQQTISRSFQAIGSAINQADGMVSDYRRRALLNGVMGKTPDGRTITPRERPARRFGAGREAMQQLSGVGSLARGFGQAIGALSNDVKAGRVPGLAKPEDRPSVRMASHTRLNELVDASSREGFLALRANQRSARDSDGAKAARETAKHSKRNADASEKALKRLDEMARFWRELSVWGPASA